MGVTYGYFCEDARAALDYGEEEWGVSEEELFIPFTAWQNTWFFMPDWVA